MPQTILKKRQYERGLLNTDIAASAGILLSKLENNGNDIFLRDGSRQMQGNIDMNNGFRVINLLEPVNPQDAATKSYVDAAVQGLDIKGSVRAATTANITLSGTQTIDGVALSVGQRVLVKDQTTASQNGLYTVQTGAWTRADDANTNPEVTPGMFTFVEEGTANQNSGWVLTTNGSVTLGTTALSFQQFSGAGQITANNGVTKSGNTLSAVGVAGRISVGASGIDLASIRSAVNDTALMLQNKDVYGRVTAETAATTTHLNEGTRLYFLESRVLLTTLNGLPVTAGGAITAADTVLNAFDKLSKAIVTKQDAHANLTALSGLTGAAMRAPIFTGAGSMELYTVTTEARALLDDTSSSMMRDTLGLTIGTNVQAQNTTLQGIANIGGAAPNGFLKKSALNTWEIDTTTYLSTTNGLDLSKIRTREVPTGLVNGVNKVFNLAVTPRAGTEQVFIMGQLMHQGAGNDYTISGTTITFTDAPIVDDIILVNYIAQ
jgi:hypothetical protein